MTIANRTGANDLADGPDEFGAKWHMLLHMSPLH
jgi:hypothetical protein